MEACALSFSVLQTLSRVFGGVLILATLFIVATSLAMAVYPGGTALNSSEIGYHFWLNFLSDLGRTRARNGASNALASLLFTFGLCCAGAALAVFSVGFAALFWNGLGQRVAGAMGATTGVLAGVCFAGVAINPANINGYTHAVYVVWAFRFFLLSSLCFSLVIVRQNLYPRALAGIFAVFTALLFAYLLLLARGPDTDSLRGLMIQAIGQKLIVYAAIACVGAQALCARRFVMRQK